MLHILLMILKTIGIILLVIIGFVLAIVLCALFVPIRYRFDIDYHGKVKCQVKVTYLMHIISAKYSLGDSDRQNKRFVLKILGFTLKGRKEKEAEEKHFDEETEMFMDIANEMKNKKSFNKTDALNQDIIEITEDTIEDTDREIHENNDNTKAYDEISSDTVHSEDSNTGINKENGEITDSDEDEEGIFFRIYNKIKLKFINIFKTIKNICGKIKKTIVGLFKNIHGAYGRIKDIIEFLQEESTKEAINLCKQQLFVFLNHIKPRRIVGNIHFGFENPATTGEVLGFISMFYGFIPKKLKLEADFENTVLEGQVMMCGRLQLYKVVMIALKLYMNENIKKLIERRRKHG